MKGKIYIIGAGPGDPELITLKGKKILSQCDVVVYDELVDTEILKYCSEGTEFVRADRFSGEKRQELINRFLVERAMEGKKIVRLKNGDPFIFGRSNEEISYLEEKGVDFVVIPGITSANCASCYSGVPLTKRNISSSVIFLTGHQNENAENPINWEAVSKIETIVFYMFVEKAGFIVENLIKNGLDEKTPFVIVSNVSKIGQKIVKGEIFKLEEIIRENSITSPSILIIGRVAERSFDWFKRQKKILFTGLSPKRYFEDGIIFHLPLIKIIPLSDYREFDCVIENIESFDWDWIIFTSRFGVYYFFKRFFNLKRDSRDLSGIKIAAIGNSTANKLKKYGILADLIPLKESSIGLIEEFSKINIRGKRIFLPRSDLSDKGIKNKLEEMGAIVVECICYKNIMPDNIPDIDFNFFDEIIFTSPSTVRNFKKRFKNLPENLKIRTIGEVTERTLMEEFGYEKIEKD